LSIRIKLGLLTTRINWEKETTDCGNLLSIEKLSRRSVEPKRVVRIIAWNSE